MSSSSSTEERTVDALKIVIDRDVCCAYKACIDEAPQLFSLGDDSIVTFNEDCSSQERETILEACRACPVEALTVLDTDGNALVP